MNIKIDQIERRQAFLDHETILPELEMVGHSTLTTAVSPLEAHVHSESFEICFIEQGRVEWWAEDERYIVNANQIYLTRPGELHGATTETLEPCRLFWLQIKRPIGARFIGLSVTESRKLIEVLDHTPNRVINANAEIRLMFHLIVEEHRKQGSAATALVRASLQLLLIQIARELGMQSGTPEGVSSQIRKTQKWMLENASNPIQLNHIAKVINISPNYFATKFRKEVGLSPIDWLNRERVRIACDMLNNKEANILNVAMECGFQSSQYFGTVFRKYVGRTPTEYRTKSAHHS